MVEWCGRNNLQLHVAKTTKKAMGTSTLSYLCNNVTFALYCICYVFFFLMDTFYIKTACTIYLLLPGLDCIIFLSFTMANTHRKYTVFSETWLPRSRVQIQKQLCSLSGADVILSKSYQVTLANCRWLCLVCALQNFFFFF